MKLNPLVMMLKEFDECGIIFDPETNHSTAMNAVGTVIWEALQNGSSEEEIVKILTDRFDVTKDIAAEDVRIFLETLKQRGLLCDE